MAKGNLQRELGVGGGNKYVSLKQEIPILLHQKRPKKSPKLGLSAAWRWWVDPRDGCLRLGVRRPAAQSRPGSPGP